MRRTIDVATWNRKEHFEFFSKMDDPYHGLVVNIDCTVAYLHCKTVGQPFFLTYLHHILCAVNATEAMRLRIEDNEVAAYDQVHASVTIARPDHTFGFCPLTFESDFDKFAKMALVDIERVRGGAGLGLNTAKLRTNEVHFSALPGVQFTGLTHARSFGPTHGEPKISAGRVFSEAGRWKMPLATFVHHGLVDGYHVSEFLRFAQELMSGAEIQ